MNLDETVERPTLDMEEQLDISKDFWVRKSAQIILENIHLLWSQITCVSPKPLAV